MPKKINCTFKGTEPSPKGFGFCARNERLAKKRKGVDGNIWIVAERSNGSFYWKRYSTGIKDKKISKKQQSKKSNKGYKWLKLKLFLIVDGNQWIGSIKTGNTDMDKLIEQRIKKDKTDIKRIFYDHKVLGMKYDGGPFVYLKIQETKNGLDQNDLKKMQEDIEMGPDTWMEGNIEILTKEEANKTKKFKNSGGVELGVGIATMKWLDKI